MKTSEEMKPARNVNDDPDLDLKPEATPADEDIEEGDEEQQEEETDLPPAMPPGV